MIAELGHFALILALCLAFVQALVPLAGTLANKPLWIATARPLSCGQFVFVAISFACLVTVFLQDDFSVAYVANNSNSLLPYYYKVSAVWGAHEGSLLLWVLILAGWTLAVAVFSRTLPGDMVARVLSVMGMIAVGFYLFMLLTSNPFERFLPFPPTDGKDLNPLLQDVGLIIHPPMLYMGYVGFSVAFAFAVAALLAGRMDSAWARWTRPWTNAAWSFLTVGIFLGSWWAYYELGWGGWWFWDPVENASLMPWLAATALLHSVSVLAARDALRTWTIMLGVIAFSMSMLGTFLVRSGILTSVHAFAVDPERGSFILALLALYIGGALVIFALRAHTISEGERFNLVSREGALVVNNIGLSAILGIVLLGTLYPLLTEAFDVRVSVGPPYFNPVSAIFFLPMMVVLMVGPLLRWRRDEFSRIIKPVALVAAIVITVLIRVAIVNDISILSMLGLAFAAGLAVASFAPLFKRALHRTPLAIWGMCIAHFGIAVALFGMAADTAFQQERLVATSVGDVVEVGPWTGRLDSVKAVAGPNWTAMQANMLLSYNGGPELEAHPQSRNFWTPQMETSEVALLTRWNGQLYVAVGNQAEDGRWQLRLWWKPFVTFIWYGGLLIALGGGLALVGRVVGDLRRRRQAAEGFDDEDLDDASETVPTA